MAERCHRGFSAGSGRRRGSSSTVDLENSLPSPPILWRSGKSVDFRGSSEAPGGPRRLPRGSQRSLEICDCLLVFRRFFGCGPRERDAQGGGGRLAVLPFPSPAFHLLLLLPSPPFPGQCGYGAILDIRIPSVQVALSLRRFLPRVVLHPRRQLRAAQCVRLGAR